MVPRRREHVIEREQVRARNSTDCLLDLGQHRALRLCLGPIGRSAVVVRLRHFATVLAFRP